MVIPETHYPWRREYLRMGGGEQTHPKNLDKPIKRVHKNLNRGVCVGGDVACLKPITSFHYSFPYFHFNFLHGPKKVWGGVCWQLRYNVLFVNVIKCLLQQKSVDKPPPPPPPAPWCYMFVPGLRFTKELMTKKRHQIVLIPSLTWTDIWKFATRWD